MAAEVKALSVTQTGFFFKSLQRNRGSNISNRLWKYLTSLEKMGENSVMAAVMILGERVGALAPYFEFES